MSYGIGRVPQDVDPTAEAMAQLEAEEIMAQAVTAKRSAPPPAVPWRTGPGLMGQGFLTWRSAIPHYEPERACLLCGTLLRRSPDAATPHFTDNSNHSLCDPCGRGRLAEIDGAAWEFLTAHAEALRDRAITLHRGNDHQLGARHWIWLVGHASLNLCTAGGLEAPSWWAAWRDDESPLARLANEILGGAPEGLTARAPSAFRCRKCGVVGHEGGYPFSTNPGSGLCDDCH